MDTVYLKLSTGCLSSYQRACQGVPWTVIGWLLGDICGLIVVGSVKGPRVGWDRSVDAVPTPPVNRNGAFRSHSPARTGDYSSQRLAWSVLRVASRPRIDFVSSQGLRISDREMTERRSWLHGELSKEQAEGELNVKPQLQTLLLLHIFYACAHAVFFKKVLGNMHACNCAEKHSRWGCRPPCARVSELTNSSYKSTYCMLAHVYIHIACRKVYPLALLNIYTTNAIRF